MRELCPKPGKRALMIPLDKFKASISKDAEPSLRVWHVPTGVWATKYLGDGDVPTSIWNLIGEVRLELGDVPLDFGPSEKKILTEIFRSENTLRMRLTYTPTNVSVETPVDPRILPKKIKTRLVHELNSEIAKKAHVIYREDHPSPPKRKKKR